MRALDVNPSIYIVFKKNKEISKFKVGDNIRILKYKYIFEKWYALNCSAEVFVIRKVKNTVPRIYVFAPLTVKKLLECFMKRDFKKQIKKNSYLKR